jgi:tRNA nucleotidyltransferase (CCA-adding enzyme)
MTNCMKLLKEVLGEIKPGKKEKDADVFVSKINSEIRKCKIKASVIVGGSFAKDTFLKEDHDVDIFVLFDLKYKDENLSLMLNKILAKFRPTLVHGSRDYYKIKNKLNYEIVPVLGIKKPSDAQNVTDFSPWHVRWVNKNGKKYTDEIRLAKKFCKVAKVYGAESYKQGFSGHVLDIIVTYYKGFLPLLKAARKWKEKEVIDYYNYHKGKALFNLNKSKLVSPLIVVDPLQSDRNAAAALSLEKFNVFKKAAEEFLKKPSKKFFTEARFDVAELKKKGAVIVEAEALAGKEDVVGSKLLKVFEHVREKLADFGVVKADWEWKPGRNAVFYFMLKAKKLPETEVLTGPHAEQKEFVKDFRKKHKKTFASKGRIFAVEKREYRKADDFVNALLKDQYVKERAKKCRLIS